MTPYPLIYHVLTLQLLPKWLGDGFRRVLRFPPLLTTG